MRQLCQASSYLLHFHDFSATNEAEKEDKTWKLAKNFVPLHKVMKKNFLMMLALMLTTSLTMMADNDRVINFEQLPAPAQALLKQSFGDKVVLIATAEATK